MAGDLTVDYVVLESSISTLDGLKSDFDGIKTRGNETEDLWGHRDIRDAMDEFTSNMDHHRKALSQEISDVGEQLEAAVDTFRDADQKLKDELDKNTTDEGSS